MLAGMIGLLAGCQSEPTVVPPPPPPPPDTVSTPSSIALGWAELPASPVNANGHFQDAWFIDRNEGWVVSINGEVHHTTDGGATWEKLRESVSNGSSLFRSVAFVSSTLGWIGDLNAFNNPEPSRALWETRDGGRTYQNITQKINGPVPVGICGLYALDGQNIYGVGRWSGPAVFIRTADGGATWQSVSLAPMMTGAVDVYFFDKLNGVIAGARGVGNSIPEQNSSRSVIATTSDGGQTWQERFVGSTTGHWSWKISFPSRQVGYVAVQGPGADYHILKTMDGGITWLEIQIPSVDGAFAGAGFISPTTGWIAAEDMAYETRDGGATWKRSRWVNGQSINRFRLFPSGGGFAVGPRIFKYTPPA
jgi:photosystem II stability/assembly factor-like uncharacterized protein